MSKSVPLLVPPFVHESQPVGNAECRTVGSRLATHLAGASEIVVRLTATSGLAIVGTLAHAHPSGGLMANGLSIPDDDNDLERAIRAKFPSERANLERLEAVGLTGVVRDRAALLRSIAEGTTRRRPRRKLNSKDRVFLREFLDFGAKAILSTGAQRGGDFLNNQLRGRWAERVVLSMTLPRFRFLAFGPSGAADAWPRRPPPCSHDLRRNRKTQRQAAGPHRVRFGGVERLRRRRATPRSDMA